MQVATGTRMRVLLFEDDRALSEVLTEFLTGEGIAVVAVADRAAARRVAAEGHWDVCIADCSPFSNAQLDSEDRTLFETLAGRAPVILTTGRAWTRDVSPRDLGVAAILEKPFDLQALLAELMAARSVAAASRTQADGS